MNHGDAIIYGLAVRAGMAYGGEVTNVSVTYHEASTLDAWAMEVWTKFETLDIDGKAGVHFLSGHPSTLMAEALEESTTIPVEW